MVTSQDDFVYIEAYGDLSLHVWLDDNGLWMWTIYSEDESDSYHLQGGTMPYKCGKEAILDGQKELRRFLKNDWLWGDNTIALEARKRYEKT